MARKCRAKGAGGPKVGQARHPRPGDREGRESGDRQRCSVKSVVPSTDNTESGPAPENRESGAVFESPKAPQPVSRRFVVCFFLLVTIMIVACFWCIAIVHQNSENRYENVVRENYNLKDRVVALVDTELELKDRLNKTEHETIELQGRLEAAKDDNLELQELLETAEGEKVQLKARLDKLQKEKEQLLEKLRHSEKELLQCKEDLKSYGSAAIGAAALVAVIVVGTVLCVGGGK